VTALVVALVLVSACGKAKRPATCEGAINSVKMPASLDGFTSVAKSGPDRTLESTAVDH
jgi:hypothetical protein